MQTMFLKDCPSLSLRVIEHVHLTRGSDSLLDAVYVSITRVTGHTKPDAYQL